MARVISVFLPMWPTDRLRRQAGDTAAFAEGPLIIAGRVGNRRLVTAACAQAQALGLRARLHELTDTLGAVALRLNRSDVLRDKQDEIRIASPELFSTDVLLRH